MGLKLQAWYWKGYKEYYTQNYFDYGPNINILSRFVKYDEIRTKRIYEPNANLIHNYSPDFEDRDSSFFDLTLFNHNNKPLNSGNNIEFFIGIQNRRTDPLIFNYNVNGNDTIRQMSFYSQVEWDTYMRDDFSNNDLLGIPRDSTWWKEQYWKRLGIREFYIPFKKYGFNNGQFIVINELGANELDSLGWYYHNDYYDVIKEEILTFDDSLKLTLFPGQGKILKVNYPYYYQIDSTLPDTCNLCETINDFDKISLEIEQVDTTGLEGMCCYNFTLTNNSDCFYDSIPYRVIVSSTTGSLDSIEFNGLLGTDTILDPVPAKYKQYYYNLDSNVSIEAFQLCLPEGHKYKIEFIIGDFEEENFWACNRNITNFIECDSVPIDCCDGIENLFSIDTVYKQSIGISEIIGNCANGVGIIKCANKLTIDSNFNSNCFYSIAIDFSSYGRNLIPILTGQPNMPINFDLVTNESLGEIVFYSCDICDTNTNYNIKKYPLYFLGKDGETLYVDSIALKVCCTGKPIYFDYEGPIFQKQNIDINVDDNVDKINISTNNLDIKIIPNPNDGNFKIEFNNKIKQDLEIEILNQFGEKLFVFENTTYELGTHIKQANLTRISNGMYYVRFKGIETNIAVPIVIMK